MLRSATADDAGAIAALHAESWRANYRGILRDAFLNGELNENRRTLWHARLTAPVPHQHVIVAVPDGDPSGSILGFVCVFGQDDPAWGAYIDNLHVRPRAQGRGIGRALLIEALGWVAAADPAAGAYLWVFEANHAARRFYERLGGTHVETTEAEVPGGGTTNRCRYAWTAESR